VISAEVSTEAIAKNKAIQGAQLANGPCVVEDTSLEFTALGGMPGPYIKW
jgi:inosine triphosphate pyrophosphatase